MERNSWTWAVRETAVHVPLEQLVSEIESA
jgi:hypothetical protein